VITITKIFNFCAGHRLHLPEMSDSENFELFGACSNPAGHGHNYVLEITVSGNVDPKTGMIIDLKDLKDVVTREIIDQVDHKNLNCDVPWLSGKIPTTEVFADAIWQRLRENIFSVARRITLMKVVLRETPFNVVEIT
jgi:6-pyruvoyltetrahydropterin/6-carboxytetrahydropterin synthase